MGIQGGCRAMLTVGLVSMIAACGSDGTGGARGSVNTVNEDAATVTNLVSSPASMAVGDVYQVLFGNGEQGVIDLSGGNKNAEYVVALVNLNQSGGSSYVQISGDRSVDTTGGKAVASLSQSEDASAGWSWTANDALHDRIRTWDQELAGTLPVPQYSVAKSLSGKAATSLPRLGDVESFRVLSSIASLSSYTEVRGRLVCIGEHVHWYVDTQVTAGSASELSSEEQQTLCENFERVAAEEMALIGAASDVNDDGHVAVLMTPQVNRIGASGGGIVTGFFLASDLYAQTRSNPTSNYREMIYVLTPDPFGQFGSSVSKELVLNNLIPAVLPHELQHAISYNQHVFEGGGLPEESWLNEGLSHLMEDVLGLGMENPSRYAIYLQNPAYYGIITPGSPGLAERGGEFLFLRYLLEQHPEGSTLLRNLLQTDLTGVANIEAAFAGSDAEFDQLSEFLLRWSATMAMNDTGLSNDPRYNYAAQELDAGTGLYRGVCTVCAAGDGRGTILNGVKFAPFSSNGTASLDAASVQFYKISAAHDRLTLWSTFGGEYGAVVVRTK